MLQYKQKNEKKQTIISDIKTAVEVEDMAYVFIIPGGVYPGLKAVSSNTAFSYMVVVDL